MTMINLARAETPLGEPVMSDSDLAVYVAAFERSGFTGGITETLIATCTCWGKWTQSSISPR
ncbi:hypothetical protein SAMN04487974_13010 [Pelagibacterium luteolum]|uniref:Uncharacterized protein n=1 Tax=Pelagibacterium luteolum TaxID=440168 RepID=A0A1G8AGR0_9HYPH|nr:hypothetical protein SAMN04487974_13010 [Pelagibacterium luteolum]